MDFTNIISTILGGALAAGAGWFVTWRTENAKRNEMSNFLKRAILDDLKYSITIYEKIQDDWSKNSLIWFISINEFKKSRKTYEKYDDHILLFGSDDLRNRVWNYYLKSETLISILENQQTRKYILDNKYNDLFREIKLKDGALSDEKIAELTRDLMKNEQIELNFINQAMPINVSKLDRFINEAQNIINLIEKI